MSDPITIKLIFGGATSGSGSINLSRNDFNTTAGGRYLSASVQSGSRIGPSLFGVLPQGSIKKVSISATTHNPNDVAQVVTGSVVRTEVDLQGQQQAVSFGPADELVFILAARTEVVLIVNELSEAEEAAKIDPVVAFIHRISLRKSDGSGFSATGTASPTLTWDPNARISLATSVGAGSIPLRLLTRKQYEGATLRVRVTGCEDQTAQVGVTQAFTGDFYLGQTIARGEWSQPFTLSHDDLLAIESSGLRAGCPAVVADVEVLPERPHTAVAVAAPSSVDTPGGSAGVAGEIPLGEWENLSINHAGFEASSSGLLLYTRDHNGNSANFFQGAGKGNKATMVSSVLDDMPLGQLTTLDIQYVDRSTGNTATLNIPYVNLVVNTGTEIKIFVMGRQGGDPALDLLSRTAIGDSQDHRHLLAWNGQRVQVVNFLAGVTPSVDLGATWQSKAYDVAAVLAQYPQARIVRAFPNDNGLMRDTIYSGLLINLGDSGYEENSRALVERVRFNM